MNNLVGKRLVTGATLVCAMILFGCIDGDGDAPQSANPEDASSTPSTLDAELSDAILGEETDRSVSLDSGTAPADAMVQNDAAAEPIDQAVADTATPTDMMRPHTRVPCDLNIELSAPASDSFANFYGEVTVQGFVTNAAAEPVSGADVQILGRRDDVIGQTITNEAGAFNLVVTREDIGDAPLNVEAVVLVDGGFCGPNPKRKVYRCFEQFRETFETEPQNWVLHGDAEWNSGGWLEMTGNLGGKKGAAYNNVDAISSGLASIEFVLATGGGSNGGADGFALTIIDIADASELDALITGASRGGGLGYAVAPPFGANGYNWVGEALTVEIDTWHNDWNNFEDEGVQPDPTMENHIALTQNGNPSDHIVWFAVPDVEDLMPHTVKVDLMSEMIRITYDGAVVIEEPIAFAFKGGYMFFSGSTGWATNYHRFEALDILSNCF